MVRKHGSLTKDEEINEASWVAARGAATGAAKWGLFSILAAGAGYAFSPLYRGLTFQFKVFLQMSGMTAGAIIDADRRLIAHEKLMRNRKKVARDAEVWRRYEEDYQLLLEEQGTPTGTGTTYTSTTASTSMNKDAAPPPKNKKKEEEE